MQTQKVWTKEDWSKWYNHKSNKEQWIEAKEAETTDRLLTVLTDADERGAWSNVW